MFSKQVLTLKCVYKVEKKTPLATVPGTVATTVFRKEPRGVRGGMVKGSLCSGKVFRSLLNLCLTRCAGMRVRVCMCMCVWASLAQKCMAQLCAATANCAWSWGAGSCREKKIPELPFIPKWGAPVPAFKERLVEGWRRKLKIGPLDINNLVPPSAGEAERRGTGKGKIEVGQSWHHFSDFQ